MAKKSNKNNSNKKVKFVSVISYPNGVTVKVFGGDGKLSNGEFVKTKKMPVKISASEGIVSTHILKGNKELCVEPHEGGFKVV